MEKLSRTDAVTRAPEGWTYLVDGLQTRVSTLGFAAGVALVGQIGAAAERLGHFPDVRVRSDGVDVRLVTPEVRGITEADLRLATEITMLVEQAGLTTSTVDTSRLEFGLDTPDASAVGPFWAAVLGARDAYGGDFSDEVRDARERLPTVWFQQSGTTEPRQRWHPDVWVDPGAVRDRIVAAVAVGGVLVNDEEAPAFWVLADPQGNRVCLCTWQGRD